MNRPRRRSLLWWLLPLFVACAVASHRERTPRPPAAARTEPPRSDRLYTAEEALGDALSSPWDHVGTGKWPGINRSYACAFRNARVFIVSVYCGIQDRPAIRLDVYSPLRGRVSIYGEAKGPVSELRRTDYFTFMVESAPAPPRVAGLPPLRLTMSFDELHAYEQRRYDAFMPTCYGGQEHAQPRSGCLDSLAAREPEWARDNRAFLAHASDGWYRIVRELRVAAARYGREPD